MHDRVPGLYHTYGKGCTQTGPFRGERGGCISVPFVTSYHLMAGRAVGLCLLTRSDSRLTTSQLLHGASTALVSLHNFGSTSTASRVAKM